MLYRVWPTTGTGPKICHNISTSMDAKQFSAPDQGLLSSSLSFWIDCEFGYFHHTIPTQGLQSLPLCSSLPPAPPNSISRKMHLYSLWGAHLCQTQRIMTPKLWGSSMLTLWCALTPHVWCCQKIYHWSSFIRVQSIIHHHLSN